MIFSAFFRKLTVRSLWIQFDHLKHVRMNFGKKAVEPKTFAYPLPKHHAAALYTIYLTFDDGPSAGSEIVNELTEKEGLPVNVFLIGRNACLTQRSRQLFRSYRSNPLVEIGNHSFSHAGHRYDKYYRQPSSVLADIDRSRDSLQLENGLVRLPGRNIFRVGNLCRDDHDNGSAAADTLAAKGYRIFGWDLEWRCHPGKGIGLHTGQEMMEIVSSLLRHKKTFHQGRLVILLHDKELLDENFRTELEAFIYLVKQNGNYRFGHLSDYR